MDIFSGVKILSPELKKLEQEREKRRHKRQEVTITAMIEEGSLLPSLTKKEARDILWSLTGRDLYRMLVIEQKWSSYSYESWLWNLLVKSLLKDKT